MIIVDISGIAVASAAIAFKMEGSSGDDELDKAHIRHLTINTIRDINKRYRNKYGEVVIAFDSDSYWRRDIFPNYKAKRKEKRKENDSVPWELMYQVLSELREDFYTVFGYNVIYIDKAEADDIIGVLVKEKSEDMSSEKIMIVSNDGDFKQLQKYPNVKQYSTMQSKMVIEADPAYWLKTKKIKGDKKDGIPNIFSKLDHFVKTPELRQKPVTKKFLSEVIHVPVDSKLSKQELGRYKQNEILIDFEYIPKKLRSKIIDKYNSNETFNNQSKVFDYLCRHSMKLLVDCVADFKQQDTI